MEINNMKVYYSDNELTIRNMRIEDAQKIYDTLFVIWMASLHGNI